MRAAELYALRIATRLSRLPSVLRLDAERGGNRGRFDPWMADTQRNRKFVLAHGSVRWSSWPDIDAALATSTGTPET
jgi:hypothetical protein